LKRYGVGYKPAPAIVSREYLKLAAGA
jgi:hypothetical protein